MSYNMRREQKKLFWLIICKIPKLPLKESNIEDEQNNYLIKKQY